MSNILKIELNSNGFDELFKSKELESMLGEIASGIASRSGDGYASDTKMMSSRVIASAYTDTTEAMKDCLDNNTLLKELHI